MVPQSSPSYRHIQWAARPRTFDGLRVVYLDGGRGMSPLVRASVELASRVFAVIQWVFSVVVYRRRMHATIRRATSCGILITTHGKVNARADLQSAADAVDVASASEHGTPVEVFHAKVCKRAARWWTTCF